MTVEAAFRIILTLVVMYFWTDNLLRIYREWHIRRDARSFRAFLIGVLLEVGVITLVMSALASLFPELVIPARLFALMTTGALLVVGIWTWISWRRR